MKYGILAYGSLIDNPGEEIEKHLEKIIDNVEIPFNVEFARSSSGRCGAPTLVPYEKGEKVIGKILVLKEGVKEQEVKNILYRREINKIGDKDKIFDDKNILSLKECYKNNSKSICKIIELENFEGLDKVFTTSFSANITDLTAEKLANLAIKSFENIECSKEKRDGIHYLYNSKKYLIKTKLSEEYEKNILEKTGKNNLNSLLE